MEWKSKESNNLNCSSNCKWTVVVFSFSSKDWARKLPLFCCRRHSYHHRSLLVYICNTCVLHSKNFIFFLVNSWIQHADSDFFSLLLFRLIAKSAPRHEQYFDKRSHSKGVIYNWIWKIKVIALLWLYEDSSKPKSFAFVNDCFICCACRNSLVSDLSKKQQPIETKTAETGE